MGIEAVIPHEAYSERSRNRANDIGLIRMNGDVYYTDYIKPICLPSAISFSRTAPNAQYTSVGWGRTLKGTQFSNIEIIICVWSDNPNHFLFYK